MEKDLLNVVNITTAECFFCKDSFRLYDVQKIGIQICGVCGGNNSLSKLFTLPFLFKQIVEFAELKNEKIEDRLVVDVSELIEKLQGDK